jgi:membrane-associated protein
MDILQILIDLLRDPRSFIADWINTLGPIWVYTPLFIIIFLETGLVVTPFLPGDSLLFAAGIFAADGGGLNLGALLVLMYVAAILGNTSNYWIGRKIGGAIVKSGRIKSLTPERIKKTQDMFDKYGFLAIVLTRFFPIIRTFAPFLAGLGRMSFPRFTLFNVCGGVLWVSIFVLLGYFFGGIPLIQDHFELVIVGIVVISFIPTVVGLIKAKTASKTNEQKNNDIEKVASKTNEQNDNEAEKVADKENDNGAEKDS